MAIYNYISRVLYQLPLMCSKCQHSTPTGSWIVIDNCQLYFHIRLIYSNMPNRYFPNNPVHANGWKVQCSVVLVYWYEYINDTALPIIMAKHTACNLWYPLTCINFGAYVTKLSSNVLIHIFNKRIVKVTATDLNPVITILYVKVCIESWAWHRDI